MNRHVTARDLRVSIVADNASARFGGESILPLHYFRRLRARGVEAWLIAHSRVRDELLALLPEEAARMHFVPDLWSHKFLYRIGRWLPSRVAVNTTGIAMLAVTQRAQRRMLRKLVPELGLDVVHVPAPVSPKFPSGIHDVGAPVIFGPMNGGMTFPAGFRSYQSRFERCFLRVGRALAPWVHRLIPGKRRAAAQLVANSRTRDALPKGTCPHVIELVENAVDLDLFGTPGMQKSDGRMRFVYLGRLVDFKAVDHLIDAMAQTVARADVELHVIGSGPQRAALEARAAGHNLGSRVVFHGFVPQEDCPKLLEEADGLVLPSLHECGGAVVLEAMAMGLPVIATRWGGPADYLSDDAGILIEPTNPEQFVKALSDAMVRLAGSPALRAKYRERGHARIRELYDWRKKIDRIVEIYGDVCGATKGTSPKKAAISPKVERGVSTR